VVVALVGAVVLSASKAAWICLAFGALLWFPNRERAWGWRTRFAVPFVLVGVSVAIYAPVLVGSKAMLDAARSRHSLNVRAVQMVAEHPVLGAGPGSSVEIEMVEFPHYRVNGVDAHGVVQKVAGETGLAGLLAYGVFAGVVLITAARRRRFSAPHAGAAGTILVLHLSLLLSTETFSPTHWYVFAVAWGLLHGPRTGTGR
jgi:O-antigen ligase